MLDYFVFGDFDSRDYGMYVFQIDVRNAKAREFEYIQIPGKHGDVIGMEKRIGNIEVAYSAVILSDNIHSADEYLKLIRSKLISVTGYARLTDSYNSDEYRLGSFVNGIEVDATLDGSKIKFVVTFNCKPQRFLLSGESTVTLTADGSIINPTDFESLPQLKVTGYGDIFIGTQKISIVDVYPYVIIDSDIGDCYYGTNNANAQVTFSMNDFPVLKSGANAITKDNTITQIDIVPRWWRV